MNSAGRGMRKCVILQIIMDELFPMCVRDESDIHRIESLSCGNANAETSTKGIFAYARKSRAVWSQHLKTQGTEKRRNDRTASKGQARR